jgi:hypothetical protein
MFFEQFGRGSIGTSKPDITNTLVNAVETGG